MMLTWNVRGLNKKSRHNEIWAHLKTLGVSCIALLETKVKKNNATKVRQIFGHDWDWLDNYDNHPNGRIWLMWKRNEMSIKVCDRSDQHIHVNFYNIAGKRMYWLTIVYAQNQLANRRILWKEIQKLVGNITEQWMVIGDFNNVLTVNDRVGGK